MVFLVIVAQTRRRQVVICKEPLRFSMEFCNTLLGTIQHFVRTRDNTPIGELEMNRRLVCGPDLRVVIG